MFLWQKPPRIFNNAAGYSKEQTMTFPYGAGQIESERAARLLDNPIRRHDADGFVVAEVATVEAQEATDTLQAVKREMLLPSDPAERKNIPITTGVLDYFPLAVAEVAKVSKAGNEQHHPGKPLHWEKGKSMDHADCIPRHLIDRGRFDSDGMRHSAKLAWRALALLQTELENEAGK